MGFQLGEDVLGIGQVDFEEGGGGVGVGVHHADVRVRSERVDEGKKSRIAELHGLRRRTEAGREKVTKLKPREIRRIEK